jgi:hypothetical protein
MAGRNANCKIVIGNGEVRIPGPALRSAERLSDDSLPLEFLFRAIGRLRLFLRMVFIYWRTYSSSSVRGRVLHPWVVRVGLGLFFLRSPASI